MPPPRSLWDSVSADDVEMLRDRYRAVEKARAEVARLNAAAREVDEELTKLAARQPKDARAAAARYLGEIP